MKAGLGIAYTDYLIPRAALSVVLMGICCAVISLGEIATRRARPPMTVAGKA